MPTVRIGFRLGLFDALHRHGPATAAELAARTGLPSATSGNGRWRRPPTATSTYDAAGERFSLSPEQAMVFAVKDSPVYLAGAFDLAAAMVEGEAKVEAAFRNGGGVAWGESSGCLFCAVGAFFRPGYVNAIVQAWLPALDGIDAALRPGAKVADVGCGVGFSTLLMARLSRTAASSATTSTPRRSNRQTPMPGRTVSPTGSASRPPRAKDIAEGDFDLVTMFDCLHDMGDPAGLRDAYAQAAEAGRYLDDRRADRRRHARATTSPTRSAGSTTTPRR